MGTNSGSSKERSGLRFGSEWGPRTVFRSVHNGTQPIHLYHASKLQGTRKMDVLVMTDAWNGYGSVLCHGCIEWKGPPSRLVMNMGRGAHSHGFFGALALPLNVLPP